MSDQAVRVGESYTSSYTRYVTVLLTVVYVCNQTDRAIFPFLMEPIKGDLSLSDSQLGFIAGPALSLLYTTLGIPIAHWADRSHRVNIMSVAIAVWSGAVAALATVGTFSQLALAQISVGLGEAGFSAIAMSVIADYYPNPDRRTRALSVFLLAIPIAGVVSSLFAGWISEIYSWRAAFTAAAVPGLLLALLMKITVSEPTRRQANSTFSEGGSAVSLRTVLFTLWRHRTLRHLAVGQCLANIVSCSSNWLPTFFLRTHNLSIGDLGNWFAVISGIGGGAGIWLSGFFSSRLGDSSERAAAKMMAIAAASITPILLVSLWCSSKELALWILIPCQALMYFYLTPTLAVVQELAPSDMRATMTSVFIFLQVSVGAAVGLQGLGLLSDALAVLSGSSASALRWSISLASVLALWAAAHFWHASRVAPQGRLMLHEVPKCH